MAKTPYHGKAHKIMKRHSRGDTGCVVSYSLSNPMCSTKSDGFKEPVLSPGLCLEKSLVRPLLPYKRDLIDHWLH